VLGTVTDQSGASIPGVSVEVKNTATGVSQTTVSDSRGRYRVSNLPIGLYEVKAELQGFQTALRTAVEVVVGSERVVDFVLSVGQVSETVTVSQQVPLVETTSSQLSSCRSTDATSSS
jgi:hypothetical protein